jgi:hypothetical protein
MIILKEAEHYPFIAFLTDGTNDGAMSASWRVDIFEKSNFRGIW